MNWTLFTKVLFHASIGLTGLLGNLVVIAVYSRKTLKTSSTIFILTLAAVDLLFCGMTPLIILHTITDGTSPNLRVCQSVNFVTNFAVYSSIVICVIIAFDRFFSVTRPHQKIMTSFRAKLLVAGCVVISALLHVNVITRATIKRLSFNVSDYQTTADNKTYFVICDISSTSSASMEDVIFGNISGVSYVVWLSIIAVLYGRIYFVIRKKMVVHNGVESNLNTNTSRSNRNYGRFETGNLQNCSAKINIRWNHVPLDATRNKRSHQGRSNNASTSQDVNNPRRKQRIDNNSEHGLHTILNQSPENRQPTENQKRKIVERRYNTTFLLFLVTAVTILTWIPSVISHATMTSYSINHEKDNVIPFLMFNFNIINHASNPIIYSLVNKRFRFDCKKLYRKLCNGN